MLEWTEAQHANGPKTAAWLRGVDRRSGYQEPTRIKAQSLSRKLIQWEEGAQPSLWALDRMLTKREMHLCDVPQDFWEQQNQPERKQ